MLTGGARAASYRRNLTACMRDDARDDDVTGVAVMVEPSESASQTSSKQSSKL